MNSFLPPLAMMLLKWTVLLALGWTANRLLCEKHSRWRRILWRSLLGFGLILPLMPFVPLPVLQIPIYSASVSSAEIPDVVPKAAMRDAVSKDDPTLHASAKPDGVNAVAGSMNPPQYPTALKTGTWPGLLLLIWVFGAAFAGFRLLRLQVQLGRLRRESHPANPPLQKAAREIWTKLRVHRMIDIRVSAAVSSPFACGLWQPAILLPQKLVQDMPADEISALLAHEIAHFCGHDLFWCVGWRWMQALFWFHPLVWKIPAAHNLACEQEADLIAAGELENCSASYPQLLARLALRVLSMSDVETLLVLNGTSQIAQRLSYLKQGKAVVWSWQRSVAGFGLAGIFFLMATGCEFSKTHHSDARVPSTVEFKKVMVVVQDEDGKPIAGASITPDGFRVKGIHGADGYGWNSKLFGPAEEATTGQDGKAWLKYPVLGIPEEKEFTGALIFSVYHPEYSTTRIQTFPIDGTNRPIQLTRGIPLEVSGYFGADHQPVTELVPNLSQEGVRAKDWQKEANGALAYHKLSPGGHLLQLMGRLPSGKIVYSDSLAFTAEKGNLGHFELEMKPGIRLEGRLDDNVPRPVKNGRVMIDVRPKEYPALTVLDDFYDLDQKYGGRYFWHSYRPINEDGTFVFESIPPGEVDVTVLGDGFASASGGQLVHRNHQTSPMPVPQPFPLTAPVTKIEVATEPTATLEFTATIKGGKPIEGVWVGTYPSVFRMRGPFGWIKKTSEEPYRESPPLPDLTFSGKTDKNGKLVLQNIPSHTRGLGVDHPQYQVPLQDPNDSRDRHVRTEFSTGQTNVMAMKLEPKGTDFIGTPR